MRAGRLDRRIDIERKTVTQAASGQPIETWTKIASRRPAEYRGVSGVETAAAPERLVAVDRVEFTVRWSNSLSDLNPLDRIVYPPSDSPLESAVYDIHAVSEIGRRIGLRIIASRRPER